MTRIVAFAVLLALVPAVPAVAKKRPTRAVIRVGSDGQVGLRAARQVFAATVAPLPGVHPPKRGYPRLHDGSGPVSWVLAHWAQLTRAQRAAVVKALPGIAVPGAPLRSAPPRGGAAKLGLAQLQPMVEQARTRLNAHFDNQVTMPVTVSTSAFASDTLDALAYTQGGPEGSCHIVFTPAGIADTVAEARLSMLHELTHCYQREIAQDLLPAWLEEGSPEWVAAVVGAEWNGAGYHSPRIAGWWEQYFATFGAPLTSRTYDGVAFFAHLAESGADVFPTLTAMYKAKPSSAVYDIAADPSTEPGKQFLGTLTSSGLRRPALGSAWTATGAMIPPASAAARYNPATRVVPNAAPGLTVTAQPLSNTAFRIQSKAEAFDLQVLSGPGAQGRLHAADGDHDLVPGTFCAFGDCSCPGGGEITPLGDQAYVALWGHKTGAAIRLVPTTRAEACGRTSTNLSVFGAFTATFDRQGSCRVSTSVGNDPVLIGLFEDSQRTGQVAFEIRPYTGPGTYTKAPLVTKYGETGGYWNHYESGTITVASESAGGWRGTVDNGVSSQPNDPDSRVTVAGGWSCAPPPGLPSG